MATRDNYAKALKLPCPDCGLGLVARTSELKDGYIYRSRVCPSGHRHSTIEVVADVDGTQRIGLLRRLARKTIIEELERLIRNLK